MNNSQHFETVPNESMIFAHFVGKHGDLLRKHWYKLGKLRDGATLHASESLAKYRGNIGTNLENCGIWKHLDDPPYGALALRSLVQQDQRPEVYGIWIRLGTIAKDPWDLSIRVHLIRVAVDSLRECRMSGINRRCCA